MHSIVDYVEHWAAVQGDKRLSTFLDVDGNETETYTYLSFHERTRHLAEYLSRHVGIRRGDRVLLVYPAGLEIVVAFTACARIGALAVPVCPPTATSFARGIAALTSVAHDCGARVALTTGSLHRELCERSRVLTTHPLEWTTTDDLRGQASVDFHNETDPILFLQYTSGSTGDPKGVIVSHANVIANCAATLDHTPTGVCWLPQYHDMGLIGYYLFLVISGGTTYGFAPLDFVRRPSLWLQSLSRFRATYTSAPNFAFDYCLREDRVRPDDLGELDLSSVRVFMNASEPVRPETYHRFLERFAPYGLRPEAHVAAYGLAEHTLTATHYGRRIIAVNKRLLQRGTAQIEPALTSDQLQLLSCGQPVDGTDLRIVDPRTREPVRDGQVGEVWLAGNSVCQGYWQRAELTRQIFANRLASNAADTNTYLRTGDLGFLDGGELFVCGRTKDVIIIRGVNYYPEDLEKIVEGASPKIRPRGVGAFASNDAPEGVTIVAEVKTPDDLPEAARITAALQQHAGLTPATVVFVRARTVSRTTSGKIARSRTRERWLNGELATLATHHTADVDPIPSAGLAQRCRDILAAFDVTRNANCTLAELGVDSVTLVRLLTEIAQSLEARDFSSDLDGRLLQRLSVAELCALLETIETASEDTPLADLQTIVQRLRREQDELEQDRIREDARLPAMHRLEPAAPEPLRSVLLTGPTGFFGPFLLGSLLRQTPYDLYVLTRAADEAAGRARIEAALRGAGVLSPALRDDFYARVHVVCGDIAQPELGLPGQPWRSLAERVQAIIHNAALVNYTLSYAALKPHNVDGTRELIRFAATGSPKELHLISSTIVFGWTPSARLLETDTNAAMRDLDFGYAQSKWVAEQLVLQAAQNGLPARIYRPSFVSASTNGIGSPNDIAIRVLAFMINHGVAVEARNQLSFLPADIAADNLVAIFTHDRTSRATVHVTVDDYYSIADITRLITREYGYPFTYYDIPSFWAEMKRRCTPAEPLFPLLDFFRQSHMKFAAMQHKRYSNDGYRAARERSGAGCADPSLNDTMSYLMASMLRSGMIAPPP